jgi:membrane-associated phospholipid phosphatase
MPDFLLQFDRHLFYFINHTLTNPFFDWIMPYLRNAKFWIPLYIFIIVFCVWKLKKTGLIIIVLLALAAGFADRTSAGLIKPIFKRVRPCRDPVVSKTDIERVDCGPAYSFPSTHATDHFAAAFFLILLFYKKWRWIWFWGILWAGLISFAQVYVGVHFPIDVFCGAIYGAFVGWLFAIIFRKLEQRLIIIPIKSTTAANPRMN